jgi:hypothetical protein
VSEPTATSFDLYVWTAPRDLDTDGARELVDGWLAAGGDPAASPFEASTDIGWFYRELKGDFPDLDAVTDAVPTGKAPVWASATNEPPARVVALRLSRQPERTQAELESILGLATKYDLVVFNPDRPSIHLPLDEMAAYASATFWPRGAIQAAVAGGAGLAIAVGAWFVGIPVVSGIAIVVGAFMFAMAVYSFIHEGRVELRRRGGQATRR